MNERIRELALRAADGMLSYDGEGEWRLNEKEVEKFAELIVQECVRVVDSMADPEDSERYFWAIQNASKKIKEHFGIEE